MNGISCSKIITTKVSVMRCIHMSWNWYRWLQLVIFVPFAKRKCMLPSYFIVNTSSVRTVSLSGKFSLSCACMGRSFLKLLIKYSDVALFSGLREKGRVLCAGHWSNLQISGHLVMVPRACSFSCSSSGHQLHIPSLGYSIWPGIRKQASYRIVVYMLRCSDSSWSFL